MVQVAGSRDTDEDDIADREDDDRDDLAALADVPILQRAAWPSADSLHVDQSQLRAVQTALTKRIAIIQGPPGTGKTYIGLKVVQVCDWLLTCFTAPQ